MFEKECPANRGQKIFFQESEMEKTDNKTKNERQKKKRERNVLRIETYPRPGS